MEMTNLPMSKEVMTGNTIVDATLVIVAVIVKRQLKYLNEFIQGGFLCHYFLDRVELDHDWVKFSRNQVQGQKIKSLQ